MALFTIGSILAAMAVLAAVETAIPLHARSFWSRAHVRPNLSLTFITFATNLFLNAGVVATLAWLETKRLGVLPRLGLGTAANVAIVVAVLDFSFYLAHVSMHRVPALWRYHRVHHSDPFVDVTTTVRQHPGEGLIRYAFMAPFAFALGASPGAFAVYRSWSALNAVVEHANFRVPPWIDRALSLVTTWPNMHKIHHSRDAEQTDTNYSNIFSIWDRLFATFTPSHHATGVVYGLDGFDDPATQTTAGLLALPLRETHATRARAAA